MHGTAGQHLTKLRAEITPLPGIRIEGSHSKGVRAAHAMEHPMARTAVASDELAGKFASEKESPYTRWVRNEGLDIIDGLFVPNLRTVELKPWARRGGRGVFINHEASRTSNDCYV